MCLLPRDLQSKFLRVVEQREVRRLGGTDVSIISVTNVRLLDATREGRFREDLYHRLSAVTLHLPPLRERGGDILLLAEVFIARASVKYGLPGKVLSPDARDAMMAYPWPSNLRELINVADRVVLLSDESAITAARLELDASAGDCPPAVGRPDRHTSVGPLDRSRLQRSLEAAEWRLSVAARQLGIPRNTLRYRLAKMGIPLHPGRADKRAG